jgi:hypothetical protein
LKASLENAQKELRLFEDHCHQLSFKLAQSRTMLKEQTERNKIAWEFIPEDRRSDYLGEMPQRQQDWSVSSPIRVSSNFKLQRRMLGSQANRRNKANSSGGVINDGQIFP